MKLLQFMPGSVAPLRNSPTGALLHRIICLPLLSDQIRHPDPSADGEGYTKR